MALSAGTRLGHDDVASCLVVLALLASPTAAQGVPQSPTAAPGDAGWGRQSRVRTPTDAEIAVGGKPTASPRVTW